MTDRPHYKVELTRHAERDLKRLRHGLEEATRAIAKLEDDPHAGHTLAGSLRGARSLEFNVKGSGAYRAVYSILDNERVCLIFIVGPHENIYRKAEQRYKLLVKRGEL